MIALTAADSIAEVDIHARLPADDTQAPRQSMAVRVAPRSPHIRKQVIADQVLGTDLLITSSRKCETFVPRYAAAQQRKQCCYLRSKDPSRSPAFTIDASQDRSGSANAELLSTPASLKADPDAGFGSWSCWIQYPAQLSPNGTRTIQRGNNFMQFHPKLTGVCAAELSGFKLNG